MIATFSKLGTEKLVRREMADYLAVRQRPGTSQVDAILRGADVPALGRQFPVGSRHPRRRDRDGGRAGAAGRVVVGSRSCSRCS